MHEPIAGTPGCEGFLLTFCGPETWADKDCCIQPTNELHLAFDREECIETSRIASDFSVEGTVKMCCDMDVAHIRRLHVIPPP